MSLSQRIVQRYLQAKGAVRLIPDFKEALEAFRKNDAQPMIDFISRVHGMILVDGHPPDWFKALGTVKRNSIKTLWSEGNRFLKDLPTIFDLDRFLKFPDPEGQQARWLEDRAGDLENWGKKLRTLEIALQAEDETRAVKRGGFTIIPMPGVSKKETDAALEALDAASDKIRSKFPQVLYGKIFFSTHLAAKTAAHYVHEQDTVHLNVRARKRFDDVFTLIHELGHRFEDKFLKADLKKEFWRLSTQKVYETVTYDEKLRSAMADEAVQIGKDRRDERTVTGMSDALERWIKDLMRNGVEVKRPMREFLEGKLSEEKLHSVFKGREDRTVLTDKLLHGPLAVTPYGATSPSENFADGFAHFVLGLPLPPEFVELFSRA